MECDTILLKEVNKSVCKDYIARLRVILKAYVSAKKTTTYIGTYNIPLLRYGLRVLRWIQAELWELDTKTKKVLAKDNFNHERSDVHILYLSKRYGGRGKGEGEDNHFQECTKVAQYVEGSEDPLVQIVKTSEGRRVNILMSRTQVVNKGGTANYINEDQKIGSENMKMYGQFSDNNPN